MNVTFTYPPKVYAFGCSLLVSLFLWLGSSTSVLGLSLPTSFSRLDDELKSNFSANQSPIAVATSTTLTGSSPLSVTFTGSKSYDPDGDPISFLWDFGDGTTSTQANPVHVFTQTRGKQGVIVQSYTARLTVSDNKGGITVSTNFYVSIPNKPPTVKITYPTNTDKYAVDKATVYTARAAVTDEFATELTYAWTAKLRRNDRDILVRNVAGGNPNFDILPVGCDGDVTYYVISVKVTDLGGLSSTVDSVKIYPNCGSANLNVAALQATQLTSNSVRLNWTNPSVAFDDVLVVGKAGSSITEIPNSATYTTSNSFTATGTAVLGGKALYQGKSTSLVVTDLTPGQTYYFRVYTRKGTAPSTGAVWNGGIEVSAKAATPNRPPVAVVTSTSLRGTSPLSVTFTGDKSYDPDGDIIAYNWDFGDGTSSSAANPVHVFTPTLGKLGSVQLGFTVRMFVGDNKGGYSGFQTFYVEVTNPAPTARITTPVNLSKYALNKATSYTLAAAVTDDVPSRLSYFWQAKLRINGKDQYPTTMTEANPVFTVSPIGCDGVDDYYYVFTLKVTDVGLLTAQDSVKIYPDCNSPKLNVTGLTATTLTSSSVRLNWTNPTIPFDKVVVVGRAGSTLLGNIPDPGSTFTPNPSFTGNVPGNVQVLYEGTGNSVVVTDLAPEQVYYFRVYTRAGVWSGGVEVNTKSSGVNRPPVVVATSTSLTGTSPLSVTFTGDKSSDPDGDQLFYEWAFSDGTYLNVANPVKVFTTQTGQHGSGTINNFTAQLTVTDIKGQRSTSQVFNISLNAATGSVSSVEPDKCYRVVSRVSGKVLGVEGSSLEDGALVRQRSDVNLQSQRWRFEVTDNGYYKIGAVHSNKVIDVLWGSQENGAAIQQWTFNGNWSYNQHFALQRNASGYFQIAARHSGKVLEVQNGNSDEGGQIVQNAPDGGVNQQWLIEERACTTSPPSSTTTAPPPTSVVTIDPAKCYRIQSRSSGLVLNVPNGSYDDGANLRQNANTDQAWQKWRLIPTDGGYYKMVILHNQKGVQVPSFSTTDDVLLEQWTYWGGSHQQWALQRNADGFYTFSNHNSNKAVTVRNASTAEGAAITQQTLGTGLNQQWSVSETTCPAGARSGVEELSATFSMWPNPARDRVLIDLRPALGKPVDLQLNDLFGRSIQQTHLENAPTEPYSFGIGQQPNGLYLLQIKPAGQSSTTLRLLIQR
ncbi:hypothetical protein GCM10028807_26340 [Spirosoma daeguense]